jgi:hypothetical protein
MTAFKVMVSNRSLQLLVIALAFRLLTILLIGNLSPHGFSEMANWYDGKSYLAIAESYPWPYDPPEHRLNARHYPLYPFFIYLFSLVLKNYVLSAYFVTVLAGALAVVAFYHLAKQFTARAFQISLIFCCFPPKWLSVSTFVWAEPVFVLALISAFYLLARNEYFWAFLTLGLASIARPVGPIFLSSFVLFVLFFRQVGLRTVCVLSLVAVAPFFLYHFYLYIRFDQWLLLAHTEARGGWGGSVFTYPFHGLIAGIFDQNLLGVRKIYTLVMFSVYSVFCVAAVGSLRRSPLLSLWFLPYFIFTCFLKGENFNWWMISFTRFMLAIAAPGLLLIEPYLPPKRFTVVFIALAVLGVAYAVGVSLIRSNSIPI